MYPPMSHEDQHAAMVKLSKAQDAVGRLTALVRAVACFANNSAVSCSPKPENAADAAADLDALFEMMSTVEAFAKQEDANINGPLCDPDARVYHLIEEHAAAVRAFDAATEGTPEAETARARAAETANLIGAEKPQTVRGYAAIVAFLSVDGVIDTDTAAGGALSANARDMLRRGW